MKKKSTNPKMAMMMGRAKKRPALAFRPEAPVMPRSAAPVMPAVNPMAAMAAAPQGMPAMKKGGKLKAVDKSKNPGISKLPTEVRNKMGYMKKGGMAKGCATKSDAKMIAKKEVKGHESSMHKMKMGGKCMAAGGKASQLAKANGIAVRGKTKGKIC
jgi:hypothetical protein